MIFFNQLVHFMFNFLRSEQCEERLNKYWADDKNTEMELRKLIKGIVIGSIIKGAILG